MNLYLLLGLVFSLFGLLSLWNALVWPSTFELFWSLVFLVVAAFDFREA